MAAGLSVASSGLRLGWSVDRPDDEVSVVQIAEGRLGTRRAAKSCDGGLEPFGLEALPGLLAVPDVDDAEALVGWAGEVQDQAVRGRIGQPDSDALILLLARGDFLHERVCHRSSLLLCVAWSRSR